MKPLTRNNEELELYLSRDFAGFGYNDYLLLGIYAYGFEIPYQVQQFFLQLLVDQSGLQKSHCMFQSC